MDAPKGDEEKAYILWSPKVLLQRLKISPQAFLWWKILPHRWTWNQSPLQSGFALHCWLLRFSILCPLQSGFALHCWLLRFSILCRRCCLVSSAYCTRGWRCSKPRDKPMRTSGAYDPVAVYRIWSPSHFVFTPIMIGPPLPPWELRRDGQAAHSWRTSNMTQGTKFWHNKSPLLISVMPHTVDQSASRMTQGTKF